MSIQIRNKKIKMSKQDYFDKLDRQSVSSDNHDPKLFWKTSKQVLNLGKSSSSIPSLKMHNKFAETDQAKAEMLNLYISSKTKVDDTNKDLPLLEPALNSIEISIRDVKDVLLHLNVSKASWPDLRSPRILKEGAVILAYPFLLFSIVPLTKGIFLILGKKPMFLLSSKRTTDLFQATTDQYLSCVKLGR